MPAVVDDDCECLFSRGPAVGRFSEWNQCAAVIAHAELLGEHGFQVNGDYPDIGTFVTVTGGDDIVQALCHIVLAPLLIGRRTLRAPQPRTWQIPRAGQTTRIFGSARDYVLRISCGVQPLSVGSFAGLVYRGTNLRLSFAAELEHGVNRVAFGCCRA